MSSTRFFSVITPGFQDQLLFQIHQKTAHSRGLDPMEIVTGSLQGAHLLWEWQHQHGLPGEGMGSPEQEAPSQVFWQALLVNLRASCCSSHIPVDAPHHMC